MYLSGAIRPELRGLPWVGFMLTPDTGNRPDLSSTLWAADTGCYAQGERFDLARYLRWLENLRDYRATCLFATAPDVVGDACATWERSRDVLPRIRALGFPAAYVAQDGMERAAVDWCAFDVLFVGGTTDWKLDIAPDLVRAAGERGMWCHQGRCNSLKRLRAAQAAGYDSADGTFIKYAPDKNLPQVLLWLRSIERQPAMEAS